VNIFKLKSLYAGYHNKVVLKNINLEINKNEFIGLIGPNGAGKSTLVKVMAKLLPPQQGEVYFEDKPLKNYDNKSLAKKMSYVAQNLENLVPFKVIDFLKTGRFPFQKFLEDFSPKDKIIIDEALQRTDIVHLKNRLISELSGGELQLVRLARSLVQSQDIIILDEPINGLDLKHTSQIMKVLRQLHQQKATIITVLHDINVAAEFCSRIIAFKQGNFFLDGSPAEIITSKNIKTIYETDCLVEKNPVSGLPCVYPKFK
jgi:iron complex transport system ATP-binding protein